MFNFDKINASPRRNKNHVLKAFFLLNEASDMKMEELFAGSPFDLPYQVTMFMSMYHSLLSVLRPLRSQLWVSMWVRTLESILKRLVILNVCAVQLAFSKPNKHFFLKIYSRCIVHQEWKSDCSGSAGTMECLLTQFKTMLPVGSHGQVIFWNIMGQNSSF